MPLAKTKEWFSIAVPTPSEDNKRVQLGCSLEETLEMLEAFELPSNPDLLHATRSVMKRLADKLKTDPDAVPVITDREALLDSICDQLVTLTGIAHMNSMSILGGLTEVNRSNFSKFENGLPVFNEHGKIKKGKDYTKPNLSNFV